MKLTAETCVCRGVQAVRFKAVLPKSLKLKRYTRRQKTWTLKTVAPEFTLKEMMPSIEAEAKRWEEKVLKNLTPLETKLVIPNEPINSSLPPVLFPL